MRAASVRVSAVMVACAAIGLSAACSAWIREDAVDAIAAQVQPPASAVVAKLETIANPTGQGLIVFVRSESNCAPRYAWIWLNSRTPSYALDRASQALTPRLKTVGDASPGTLRRVGSDAETLSPALLRSMCEPVRN